MPRKQPVPTDLALARVPKPPQFVKATYQLPAPLLAQLEVYGACYRALRGEPIEADALVALILDAHMSRDRAFVEWSKRSSSSGSDQGRSAARSTTEQAAG